MRLLNGHMMTKQMRNILAGILFGLLLVSTQIGKDMYCYVFFLLLYMFTMLKKFLCILNN